MIQCPLLAWWRCPGLSYFPPLPETQAVAGSLVYRLRVRHGRLPFHCDEAVGADRDLSDAAIDQECREVRAIARRLAAQPIIAPLAWLPQ